MTKTKRTGGMVLGILFIGLCVSFLRLSQFGVDPFSAMNLGISGFIGWSFGTWQLLVNAIILVVVFFQARSCIGAGTIINMVFVGYIADFICYVANDVVQIQMNLPLRILALLANMKASAADLGEKPELEGCRQLIGNYGEADCGQTLEQLKPYECRVYIRTL